MRQDSARVWAIIGALAVPLAALLGLEYLARQSAPEAPPESLAVPAATPGERETEAAPIPQPAPKVAVVPHAPTGTWRCMLQGRAIYTDKPERDCAAGTEVRAVDATPAAAGVAPTRPYQQQLAELEQARAAEAARHPVARPAAPEAPRAAQCEALWAEIQRIDSLLRQPHSAAWGDHWVAERRKLSDRRYAEHC